MESKLLAIKLILKRAKKRIFLKIFIENLIRALIVTLLLTLIISLIARVMPIYRPFSYGLYILGVSIMGAFIYSLYKIPRDNKVALVIDSLGLKERVISSIEVDSSNPYSSLLVEDTLDRLRNIQYKKGISLKPNKRYVYIAISLFFILGFSYIIPNSKERIAEEIHALNKDKKEEIKKVEKLEKEIKEDKKLSKIEREKLMAQLSDLKKDIKEAENEKDIAKAVEKSLKKLEKDSEKKLNALYDKFNKNNSTKDLASAIKNNNKEEMKEALDKLKSDLEKLSKEEKEKISKDLREGENVDNESLAKALDSLSKSLSEGDDGELTKSLASLESALEDDGNERMAAAIGNGLGNKAGLGSSKGSGSGAGKGSGAGSGSGKGSGTGSGAGSGSGNGSEGISEYGSGISNKSPGQGSEGEYEKVFKPSRIGGEGEKEILNGKINNKGKGQSSLSDKRGVGSLGEMIPYNEVIGEYSEKAMEDIEDFDIPEGMKDLIKSYFSSLED
ncbi:hypothetical protein [Clostridium sp.]|uniref:hypothetical protein n=1 Tax=Clostridium sp. TaxID=1506 RepID=UPI0034644956